MKKTLIKNITLIAVMLAVSCKQEVLTLTNETVTPDTSCTTATAGTADFTKFVAVGSSYTAGFQAGALFTEGQNNSLPAIINKQFVCAGGTVTFNQPTIGTEFGYNIFVSPNPVGNTVLGRFLLQYGGANSPKPTPQVSGVSAIPNPGINASFIYGNGSSKASLNNFGVEAIVLGQSLITQTGNWAGAGVDPRFSPFYGRLAYPGTGSTLIGDVASSGATFMMFWLGMDDFMLHAAFGGDPTKAPLTNPTGGTPADFDYQYTAAVTSIMAPNANLKGVLVNFPDVFSMPHFTAVPWNAIPLDAATAAYVNSQLSTNYNAFLAGMVQAQVLTQAEADKRQLNFVEGQNGALISDETLTDLSPYMQGPYAALQPYAMARQTTATDIFPLSAASVLGTLIDSNPAMVNGVTIPLADRYVLIPSEIAAINNARTTYNAVISSVRGNFTDRLALADVSSGMAAFLEAGAAVQNGVTLTPNINPPTGIYSEDGLHPNTRGYAFYSRMIIDAINAKFGSTVPLTNVGQYSATALPIP